MPDSRINIPSKVTRGEPFPVKLQIRHPMETGYRTDDVGKGIARNVIRTLTCRYNGEVVFAAQLSSGIAANPFLSFFVVARAPGEMTFEWIDDAGVKGSDRVDVNVG